MSSKGIENGELRMENFSDSKFHEVYENIKNTLNEARKKAYASIKFYLVEAY